MPNMSFQNLAHYKNKINYQEFFLNCKDEGFLKAIYKIAPKILEQHENHKKMISSMEILDLERRKLLCQVLELKIKYIIKPCYERACKLIKENNIVIEDPFTKLENKFNYRKPR